MSRLAKFRGFTLIELMVAVAILSILMAIAVPSYQEYVRRANKSAAQQFMLDVANREAQYLLDARSYSNSLATLGLNPPPDRVDDFYTITITTPAGNPPTYTVTATPKAGTMQAGESVLTLDQAGTKTPSAEWER